MSDQLRREGDDLQRLLNDVRDEFGPTVQILSATKTRVGGVLGFFASQRYVVFAQVPETPPRAVRPAPPAIPEIPAIPAISAIPAPAAAPAPVVAPVSSVRASRVWGDVAAQSVAETPRIAAQSASSPPACLLPAFSAAPAVPRPSATDNVADPASLARQIFHIVDERAFEGEQPHPATPEPEQAEPEATPEPATPEQAFAAALAHAVKIQAAAAPLDTFPGPTERAEVTPQIRASPEALAQEPAEASTQVVAAPVQPPARQLPAPVVPPSTAEVFVPASAYAVKPAVFARIARPAPRAEVPAPPATALPDPAATALPAPPTPAPAPAAADPLPLPAATTAPTPRRPGSRPAAGDVVAVIGDIDVILSEATALLRRWRVPTDTVTQATLADAMEHSRALVLTGPTPGLLQPHQLDGRRWAKWREADVPVVVLIPTATLTRAGSRQFARQLVALGADRVLAVVDAREETETLRHWLRGFPGVHGLLAHHVGAARNPTDVAQLGLPVVSLDARSATAARWRTYFRGEPTSVGRAAITPAALAQHRIGAR